ncbi:MAG: hypothetical protein DMF58_11415 [Acidobacteria bacterium]|nr:MAG: hypothetical protein DMF58_11415 [Acidobacteriota bacterium]
MSAVLLALVISAARILDGRGHVIRNAAVVVDGSKIVRIDPHPSHIDIDLGDRTLMPGAIDTHVHIGWHFDKNGRSNDDGGGETPDEYAMFAAENAFATLMGGVTTVQSLGAPIDKTIRDFAARKNLPLPRVLTAVDPIYDNKLTPEQIREKVRTIAAEGADVVKIFASQSIRSGCAAPCTRTVRRARGGQCSPDAHRSSTARCSISRRSTSSQNMEHSSILISILFFVTILRTRRISWESAITPRRDSHRWRRPCRKP